MLGSGDGLLNGVVGKLVGKLTKDDIGCIVEAIQKLISKEDYEKYIEPIVEKITSLLSDP